MAGLRPARPQGWAFPPYRATSCGGLCVRRLPHRELQEGTLSIVLGSQRHPPASCAPTHVSLSTCPHPSCLPRHHHVYRHSLFTLTRCTSLQLSHSPLGGRCAWVDGRGLPECQDRCWERRAPFLPLPPPTHTHAHTHGGRPRWRAPPPQLSGAALGCAAWAAGRGMCLFCAPAAGRAGGHLGHVCGRRRAGRLSIPAAVSSPPSPPHNPAQRRGAVGLAL